MNTQKPGSDTQLSGREERENKPLIKLTWDDLQKKMSIAGEPDRAVKFGRDIYELSATSMDVNNIPSVDNQIMALERMIAELKNWKKIIEKRQRIQ